MKNETVLVNIEHTIQNKIWLIRDKKVMLDYDLSDLYEIPTKRLNEAVKRNLTRFPEDFMFQLTETEHQSLRSQFATSKIPQGRGGKRYLPYAFTEQGVAMLSSVLVSERAIAVNIQIMRAFVKLKEMLLSHSELKIKMEELEKKYDGQFKIVFEAINELIDKETHQEEGPPKEPMGFQIR